MILKTNDNALVPVLSVVICSFNRKKTLAQAIDSALNQKTNFPIEILIGDDGSTDGSKDLLKSYFEKYPDIFVLNFQDRNMGVGGNWASTIKLVRGEYIALCDDDDYWHCETKLQQQVDFLMNNSEYGLVHTNYRTLDVNTGKIVEKTIYNDSSLNLLQALFSGKYRNLTSSCVFRKCLIDNHVNLDDYIKFRFPLQDWPTWILIAKYTKFGHLDISTVTYRIGVASITTIKDYTVVINRFSKEKLMYKYLCDMFPDDLSYDEKAYDSYVNSILLNLAIKQKDYPKANEFGKKIGNKSLKVLCSQNRILFWAYILLKRIKNS